MRAPRRIPPRNAARRPASAVRTLVVLAATLACAVSSTGCASDGPSGSAMDPGSSYDRSEMVPSGVTEMREQMASQRSETLDRMDSVRPESADMSTDDGTDPLGSMLDAFGWAAGKTLDVLSLQAFGLW